MENLENESKTAKPIRLKTGIIIVSIQWLLWLVAPNFVYGWTATATMVFSSLLGGLAIIIWWIFFSRIQGLAKWIALAVFVISLIILPQFSHDSIHYGMDGLMFFVFAVPSFSIAIVVWAAFSKQRSSKISLVVLSVVVLLSCSIWLLVRSHGLSGNAKADFAWRWNKTIREDKPAQKSNNDLSVLLSTQAEWPGFRGPNRDGINHESNINTDWEKNPPVELWRKPIGAGCSSFAVHGDYIFTQEQNENFELVSCYYIQSGSPIWMHKDSARFYDQHAGAGPRSTPTLNNGKVFTLGATGILNVLDIKNGSVLWSTNAATDTGAEDSGWGFASSPLVVEELVIVAAASKLIAYDINSGNKIWMYSDTTDSYSSAHLIKVDGYEQIAFMSGEGVCGINFKNGELLWKHSWPVETRILQPAIVNGSELLINSGNKKGLRKINVTRTNEKWETDEVWTSNRIRPDFNDFVVHKGHIYGFDGPTIACVDLENGQRKWRGSRYGGQMILVADQNLLLILSEKGEIILAKANPNEYTELGKIEAISGKTWNHPVLVNDVLLVRNAKEMVAYRFN